VNNSIVSGFRHDIGSKNISPVKSNSDDIQVWREVNSSQSSTATDIRQIVGNEQQVQQLENVIRALQGPEKSFEISVHKATNVIMVKVFDKQTGDLIREIPSEKILDVAADMMKLNGLIFDERA